MNEAELEARLAPLTADAARALPRPMVFTNGVFDLLHRGHVSYLMQARALGASLVVGLNSDASARRLGKGPDRPLNGEADRCAVLRALAAVDGVVIFDEDTALVRSWGGRSLALPFVAGRSTTRLVERIRGPG
jgi:cytidyltransferase-like protein